MWSLELSAGFVALITMSLYWDEYSDFRIVPSDSYVGPGKLLILLLRELYLFKYGTYPEKY